MSKDYGRLSKIGKNKVAKSERYVPFNIKTCTKCETHYEHGTKHVCDNNKENKR